MKQSSPTHLAEAQRIASLFANTCDWQAGWRQTMAAECPEVGRNHRSANALRFLAQWARDSPVQVYAALASLPPSLTEAGTKYLPFGQQASQLLSGYGYYRTASQPCAFLDDLRAAARCDELSPTAVDEFADGE